MALNRLGTQIGLAVLLSSASVAAFAQTDSSVVGRQDRGFYLGVGAGPNFQEDNKYENSGTNSTASYETGLAGILSAGYALGNGLRFEIEPGYRYNALDNIGGANGHGQTQMLTVMGNAIYDFDVHTPVFPLIPHIGIGAGWAHIWNQSSPHNGLTVKGEDDVPAFQAIAGVEYAMTPAVKIGLDYRYLVAHDASFNVPGAGGTSHVGDFNDHTVLVTLRYEFGAPREVAAAAPPPPPPPVPAQPAPTAEAPGNLPRDYTVYFDFDKATVPADGDQILQRAALDAKQGQVTRIAVTGYTDTVGSARYNQRLSERRAEAVRAALVRLGIPSDEIAIAGRGENDLAVPTAAGVREARNRRVVIVLQAPGA